MSSRLGIQEKSNNTQEMLCPCCGGTILRQAVQCGCGARFVGQPLDEIPIKVQRLGPAMTSVALLALVVTASLVATKWLSFAAVVVIWSAWRAVRLARRDAEWYGGYKTAVATLSLTIAASAALAAYGIAHIPQALENYQLRQIAATEAAMHHVANLLEEYQLANGGAYPRTVQELKKETGESLPADYWDRSIKYESGFAARADRSIGNTPMSANNFELRSAGPDGIVGTDDDIVMRDGIIFTSSSVKNHSAVQQQH
ncbi:MAG: hypothetical protein DMF60_11105 [Acidobacteria bacterium]|nr:MAG: hypothetical protein DMF60_11105 [Acidobacteriota bacterium]